MSGQPSVHFCCGSYCVMLFKRYIVLLMLCSFVLFVQYFVRKEIAYIRSFAKYNDSEFDAFKLLQKRKWSHYTGVPPNALNPEISKVVLHTKDESVISISKKINRITGLVVKEGNFVLNGRQFQIRSGEIHYFRVHPNAWKNRLRLLKACHLNTVSTYIPWNLHVPSKEKFNFNNILNLTNFLTLADSMGLYVVLRIGPYVCAEIDFGGLPAWLLKHDGIKLRTTNEVFMNHAAEWIESLVRIIHPFQYTKGGPIIAVQVENEYSGYPDYDNKYIPALKILLLKSGITEFLFTCDDLNGIKRRINTNEGMMRAINLQDNINETLGEVTAIQPTQPIFVAEFWSGWFDWWGGSHHVLGQPWKNSFNHETMRYALLDLLRWNASFNIYMFSGGTNFGFNNGAILQGNMKQYTADTTSYDYDALISEGGDVTAKYKIVKETMEEYFNIKPTSNVESDEVTRDYGELEAGEYLTLEDLLKSQNTEMKEFVEPLHMEKITDHAHGYMLYETTLNKSQHFTFGFGSSIKDRALVYLDTVYKGTFDDSKHTLKTSALHNDGYHVMSILVENQGRVNWVASNQLGVMQEQRKGIVGPILCNKKILLGWKSWPLNFNKNWTNRLNTAIKNKNILWKKIDKNLLKSPILLKFIFAIKYNIIGNTYVVLPEFEKGVIIVNNFNIGRYWNSKGPQQSLFIPGGILQKGLNEILIFEELQYGKRIILQKDLKFSK